MSALKFIVRASPCSWLSFLYLYCKLFVTFQTTASNILHSLVSWTYLKNARFEGFSVSLAIPKYRFFKCLWFRASLIYINNCPTRCNTKQSIILQVHSTCFGCQTHPSSVHKTVTTASGTGHIFCAATSLQRG